MSDPAIVIGDLKVVIGEIKDQRDQWKDRAMAAEAIAPTEADRQALTDLVALVDAIQVIRAQGKAPALKVERIAAIDKMLHRMLDGLDEAKGS